MHAAKILSNRPIPDANQKINVIKIRLKQFFSLLHSWLCKNYWRFVTMNARKIRKKNLAKIYYYYLFIYLLFF